MIVQENGSTLNLKKHVFTRFRNSNGKMITIYNTDERYNVDKVYNNYNVKDDLQMMMRTVEDTRGTKKRSGDKFVKSLYKEEHYQKYRKVDIIY